MAAPQTKQIVQISCNPSWNRALSSEIPAAPQHIPDHFMIPLVLNISPFPNGAAASSELSISCHIPFPQTNKIYSRLWTKFKAGLWFPRIYLHTTMDKKKLYHNLPHSFQESQNIKALLLPCTAQHLETKSGKNYFSIRNAQVLFGEAVSG